MTGITESGSVLLKDMQIYFLLLCFVFRGGVDGRKKLWQETQLGVHLSWTRISNHQGFNAPEQKVQQIRKRNQTWINQTSREALHLPFPLMEKGYLSWPVTMYYAARHSCFANRQHRFKPPPLKKRTSLALVTRIHNKPTNPDKTAKERK